MKTLPPFRARRRGSLFAGGIFLLLAAVALVIQQHGSVLPAEKKVRAYFAAARAQPGYWEKFAAGLGPEAIPFLLSALTNRNSESRERLLVFERQLGRVLPERLLKWMVNATDHQRDQYAAGQALSAIACTVEGPDALAPYLKDPNPHVRYIVIDTLHYAAFHGSTKSLAFLTNALSGEPDVFIRLNLATCILRHDRTNAAARSVLLDAASGTNAAAAADATATLRRLSIDQ